MGYGYQYIEEYIYVDDISELQDEVHNIETQLSEIISISSERSENDTIFFQQVLDNHTNSVILNMLLCGLLGIIIGICLVNIFKSR